MIESGDGVSDLLFAVGKPPVVERHGALEEFPIETPDGMLAPAQIEQISAHLMNGEPRLAADLARLGACDCSYSLAGAARFRVNIFRQNAARRS